MPIINGTDFLLYEGDDSIGHSANTSLKLDHDLVEVTTKNSQGWTELMGGMRSASMTVEGLVDYSDTINFENLCDRIITRQKMVYLFSDGFKYYWGFGYISSVEQTAEMETTSGYTLEILIDNKIFTTNPLVKLKWNEAFLKWNEAAQQWNNV